jgi:gentisate 1,2-dioxygenase
MNDDNNLIDFGSRTEQTPETPTYTIEYINPATGDIASVTKQAEAVITQDFVGLVDGDQRLIFSVGIGNFFTMSQVDPVTVN